MMKTIKKYFYRLLMLLFVGLVGYIVVAYYSFIFAKHVEGQVFEIRRVNQPNLVVGSASFVNPGIMHSYSVAIRTLKGDIVVASGEDRKWEVVQRGICVSATFYPYPPWNLEKGGTFHNARLNQLRECPEEYKTLPTLPIDNSSALNAQDPQVVPIPQNNSEQNQ